MRKSKQEAAETRERIVSTAATLFTRQGLEKTGLSEIMQAAGLTHGGFYKHFVSRDQLISESVALAFEKSSQALDQPKATKSLRATVETYLSKPHRNDPAAGCALPALGSELSSAENELKEIASVGINRLISQVQAQLTGLTPQQARKRANATLAAMVGAVILSRIATDPVLSDSFLRDTKDLLLERI